MPNSLLIDQVVLSRIEKEASDSYPNEAGGLFLGLRRQACIHITDMTGPQCLDRQSRTRFERRDGFHQRYASEKWLKSNGLIDWLGEWHSHPDGAPVPSAIDLRTWSNQAKARYAPMFYLIAGHAAISVYKCTPGNDSIAKLEMESRDSKSLLLRQIRGSVDVKKI